MKATSDKLLIEDIVLEIVFLIPNLVSLEALLNHRHLKILKPLCKMEEMEEVKMIMELTKEEVRLPLEELVEELVKELVVVEVEVEVRNALPKLMVYVQAISKMHSPKPLKMMTMMRIKIKNTKQLTQNEQVRTSLVYTPP